MTSRAFFIFLSEEGVVIFFNKSPSVCLLVLICVLSIFLIFFRDFLRRVGLLGLECCLPEKKGGFSRDFFFS